MVRRLQVRAPNLRERALDVRRLWAHFREFLLGSLLIRNYRHQPLEGGFVRMKLRAWRRVKHCISHIINLHTVLDDTRGRLESNSWNTPVFSAI